jgi:hypothetical protein
MTLVGFVVITAVQAINRTIEEDNPAATLTSLQQEPAKLSNLLPENALLYQALLYAEKQEKKKVCLPESGLKFITENSLLFELYLLENQSGIFLLILCYCRRKPKLN